MNILEEQRFKEKWEKAYEDIRIHSKTVLIYRILFSLRRIIFVYSIYQLYFYPSLQLCCFLYINLFSSIYQGKYNPFKSRSTNRSHLFNEFAISIIAYMTVFFTDMVDSR